MDPSHTHYRVNVDQPTTVLGRIADEMFDVIKRHEQPGIKAIVMLCDEQADDPDHSAMCAIHGYREPSDALSDVLLHLRILGAANGVNIIVGTPKEPLA